MTLPKTLPSLFLSHGAPTLPLIDTPARDFLEQIGRELDRPKAILVASAHGETAEPAVSAVETNETIHDFFGFPRPLYDLRYDAPGAPKLAGRVADLLHAAGFACNIDRRRGLVHRLEDALLDEFRPRLVVAGGDEPAEEFAAGVGFRIRHGVP